MPFRSKAQQRLFFATMPDKAKTWAAHTPDIKALPEHVEEKKASSGLDALDALNATWELNGKVAMMTAPPTAAGVAAGRAHLQGEITPSVPASAPAAMPIPPVATTPAGQTQAGPHGGMMPVRADNPMPGAPNPLGYAGIRGPGVRSPGMGDGFKWAATSFHRDLSDQEKADVDAGQSSWMPELLTGAGTPLPSTMSSPTKGAILEGGLGALVGGAAGFGLGGLAGAPEAGAALGATLGGGLGAAHGHLTRRRWNQDATDLMKRLPEGATYRDYQSDSGDGYASDAAQNLRSVRYLAKSLTDKQAAAPMRGNAYSEVAGAKPTLPGNQLSTPAGHGTLGSPIGNATAPWLQKAPHVDSPRTQQINAAALASRKQQMAAEAPALANRLEANNSGSSYASPRRRMAGGGVSPVGTARELTPSGGQGNVAAANAIRATIPEPAPSLHSSIPDEGPSSTASQGIPRTPGPIQGPPAPSSGYTPGATLSAKPPASPASGSPIRDYDPRNPQGPVQRPFAVLPPQLQKQIALRSQPRPQIPTDGSASANDVQMINERRRAMGVADGSIVPKYMGGGIGSVGGNRPDTINPAYAAMNRPAAPSGPSQLRPGFNVGASTPRPTSPSLASTTPGTYNAGMNRRSYLVPHDGDPSVGLPPVPPSGLPSSGFAMNRSGQAFHFGARPGSPDAPSNRAQHQPTSLDGTTPNPVYPDTLPPLSPSEPDRSVPQGPQTRGFSMSGNQPVYTGSRQGNADDPNSLPLDQPRNPDGSMPNPIYRTPRDQGYPEPSTMLPTRFALPGNQNDKEAGAKPTGAIEDSDHDFPLDATQPVKAPKAPTNTMMAGGRKIRVVHGIQMHRNGKWSGDGRWHKQSNVFTMGAREIMAGKENLKSWLLPSPKAAQAPQVATYQAPKPPMPPPPPRPPAPPMPPTPMKAPSVPQLAGLPGIKRAGVGDFLKKLVTRPGRQQSPYIGLESKYLGAKAFGRDEAGIPGGVSFVSSRGSGPIKGRGPAYIVKEELTRGADTHHAPSLGPREVPEHRQSSHALYLRSPGKSDPKLQEAVGAQFQDFDPRATLRKAFDRGPLFRSSQGDGIYLPELDPLQAVADRTTKQWNRTHREFSPARAGGLAAGGVAAAGGGVMALGSRKSGPTSEGPTTSERGLVSMKASPSPAAPDTAPPAAPDTPTEAPAATPDTSATARTPPADSSTPPSTAPDQGSGISPWLIGGGLAAAGLAGYGLHRWNQSRKDEDEEKAAGFKWAQLTAAPTTNAAVDDRIAGAPNDAIDATINEAAAHGGTVLGHGALKAPMLGGGLGMLLGATQAPEGHAAMGAVRGGVAGLGTTAGLGLGGLGSFAAASHFSDHPGVQLAAGLGGAALGGLAGHGAANWAMGAPAWEKDEEKEAASRRKGDGRGRGGNLPPIGHRFKKRETADRPFWQGQPRPAAKVPSPYGERDDDRMEFRAESAPMPSTSSDPMKGPRPRAALR